MIVGGGDLSSGPGSCFVTHSHLPFFSQALASFAAPNARRPLATTETLILGKRGLTERARRRHTAPGGGSS